MKDRLVRGLCSGVIFKSVFICSIALVTVSGALAGEGPGGGGATGSDNVPSSPMEAQLPAWDTFARTTILGNSKISDHGGALTMQEVDAGFSKRFSLSPRFVFSAGLHYSLRSIDAPAEARLPTSLQRMAMNMHGSYRLNDKVTFGLMVSPGLSGDFKIITSSDLRVPVGLSVHYKISPRVTLTGGFMYRIGNSELPLLPMIGAMYQASEEWAFSLAFPRTGVTFKPYKTTEYYLGAEFSAGEYQLHDPTIGASIVSYRDFRAVTGAKWRLFPNIELGVAGGYSFGRKFVFRDGARDDVNVNSAPFGRIELRFLW
jgi:hypothetical protein